MDKFLQKMQMEIENKMLAIANGESIIKPFAQIYSEVRSKVHNNKNDSIASAQERSIIYTDGEASIYAAVIQEFLKDHPELKEQQNKGEEQ